jgi:hypothetical protein
MPITPVRNTVNRIKPKKVYSSLIAGNQSPDFAYQTDYSTPNS